MALEFEKPILELESRISELQKFADDKQEDLTEEIAPPRDF
jgi:acetyl-CoA carboxylase alpha subunit